MTGKIILSVQLSVLLAAAPVPALAQEDEPVGPAGPPMCGIAEDVKAARDAWRDDDRDLPLAEVIDEIYLRSGPGASCEKTYLVPSGGSTTVVGCGADWCGIIYGTEAGFLPKTLLRPIPDMAPPIPDTWRW